MGTLTTPRLLRVTLAAAWLAGWVWLLLVRATPAHADGVVGDGSPGSCTMAALGAAMNSGSGDIYFACGPDPVIITITQNGGLNAISGTYYTIDGGNLVTLSGGDGVSGNRLFDVRVNAALTLRNIILTNGYAFSGGNLPELGGAILAEGYQLVLDNVTIRHSQSKTAGGAIKIITGTAYIQDSLIEDNYSGLGGGIDNAGTLSLGSTLALINTTVRSNHALDDSGGGLYVGGGVIFNNCLIVNNRANFFGGGIYSFLGEVMLNGTDVSGNGAAKGGGIYNNPGTTLTLNQSTLSRNTAATDGAGIYNDDGITILNYSSLSGNVASHSGGGVYNLAPSTLTLNNSALSGNSAVSGGGGILNDGTLTLNTTTLEGNRADTGGGIYNNMTLTVISSTLSGNSAVNNGGGINNRSSGTLTMNNTTLSGNSAGSSGGIDNAGTATLNSSTLSGNSAVNYGGGISNFGRATLINSTLSGNSAGAGGGILNDSMIGLWNVTLSNNAATTGGALFMASSTTLLTNTILAYSPSGGNCAGSITASKYSIDSDDTCAISGSNGNLYTDPLLSALGNYGGPTLVHMPKTGSPAINGVVGNDAPKFDQRGKSRPVGPYDIGSVERQSDDSDLAPRLYLPLLRR